MKEFLGIFLEGMSISFFISGMIWMLFGVLLIKLLRYGRKATLYPFNIKYWLNANIPSMVIHFMVAIAVVKFGSEFLDNTPITYINKMESDMLKLFLAGISVHTLIEYLLKLGGLAGHPNLDILHSSQQQDIYDISLHQFRVNEPNLTYVDYENLYILISQQSIVQAYNISEQERGIINLRIEGSGVDITTFNVDKEPYPRGKY